MSICSHEPSLRVLPVLAVVLACGGAVACAPVPPRTDSEFSSATAGYRPVERDGQRRWCREERATGALVPRVRCLTEAQLREQERAATRIRDRLTQPEACAADGCGRKEQ